MNREGEFQILDFARAKPSPAASKPASDPETANPLPAIRRRATDRPKQYERSLEILGRLLVVVVCLGVLASVVLL